MADDRIATMTDRFYIYPLVFLVLLPMGALLRQDPRWHAAQLAQVTLILLLALVGLVVPAGLVWGTIAWALYGLFIMLPRALASAAARRRREGRWGPTARCLRVAGALVRGNLGRLYREYAAVFDCLAHGEVSEAERRLDELVARPMPAATRGLVALWKLNWLVEQRAWERAAQFFEAAPAGGSLWSLTQARLLAASAYAETGQLDRALHSLLFVMISPLAVRLAALVWMTRVRVAALAGDAPEVEALLSRPECRRRGLTRFAAYWRGRCALVCGDQAAAIRELARAHALTPPWDVLWRQAILAHLQRAEAGDLSPASPLAEDYERGRAALRLAEQQSAPWRALIQTGGPALVTSVVLVLLAGVFAGECLLPAAVDERLVLWAGSGPGAVWSREWWRPFTAVFLHANALHLAMNAFGVWVFGSAIERSAGWWRMLLVFGLGGAAGNLLSAVMHPQGLSVGASGGVFALLGAFAVAVARVNLPVYAGLRRRLLGLLALAITADLIIGWLEPRVDNLAHLGGLIAGVVLAVLVFETSNFKSEIAKRAQRPSA